MNRQAFLAYLHWVRLAAEMHRIAQAPYKEFGRMTDGLEQNGRGFVCVEQGNAPCPEVEAQKGGAKKRVKIQNNSLARHNSVPVRSGTYYRSGSGKASLDLQPPPHTKQWLAFDLRAVPAPTPKP